MDVDAHVGPCQLKITAVESDSELVKGSVALSDKFIRGCVFVGQNIVLGSNYVADNISVSRNPLTFEPVTKERLLHAKTWSMKASKS